MSGRTLRRLPVLAHADYIGLEIPAEISLSKINGRSKKHKSNNGGEIRKMVGPMTDVDLWLDAMEKVVDIQIRDRSLVDSEAHQS